MRLSSRHRTAALLIRQGLHMCRKRPMFFDKFVSLAQEINGDINRKCIVIVQLFFVDRTPTKFALDSAATLYGFFSLFGPNFRSILLLT